MPGDLFIFFFFRERAQKRVGVGVERVGERESQAGSLLSVDPSAGLDLTTLRS